MHSPTADTARTGMHCSMEVVASFVKSGGASVDSSCVDHMLPVNYEGDAEQNKALFGVRDLYNGVPPEPEPACPDASSDDGTSTRFSSAAYGLVVLLLVFFLGGTAYICKLKRTIRRLRSGLDGVPLTETAEYGYL